MENTMKATRAAVYAAIDSERDYQDSRWNQSTTESGGRHSVAEFVLYMEHYLGEARRLLSTQSSPKAEQDGLDFIRKVTGMGVACMEQNGAPFRAGFEPMIARLGQAVFEAVPGILATLRRTHAKDLYILEVEAPVTPSQADIDAIVAVSKSNGVNISILLVGNLKADGRAKDDLTSSPGCQQ